METETASSTPIITESISAFCVELAHLYETAPVGLCVHDRDLRFVRINEKLAKINGKPVSAHIGRTLDEIIPKMAPRLKPILRQVLDTGEPVVNIDIHGTTPADPGNEHDWLCSYYPLKAKSGNVLGVSVVVQDITERKQAEDALRKSEERVRSIIDTAYDAFISIDASGAITAWNAQAEKTFGWPEEEAIGRSLAETIIPSRYRARHRGGLAQFLATGKSSVLNRRLEITALHRDGHEFPVELAIWASGSGQDRAFHAFVHDITDRKQAEETLRKSKQDLEASEKRYEDLYDNAPDMFASVHPATAKIIRCNQTLASALGYTKEEIIGHTPFDLCHPKSKANVQKAFQSFVERGEVKDAELQFVRKDGSAIDVSLNVSAVRDEQGKILYSNSILRDMSERKRAEKTLKMIVEATSSAVGGDFLRSLVRQLSMTLNVHFAFISQLMDHGDRKAHTLVFWAGEDFAENFEYDIKGTPCEKVIGGELAYYPEGIQKLFPSFRLLSEAGIESYLGVPFYDSSGNMNGHMGVMDDKPMTEISRIESILQIFAVRAGVELERQQTEQALQRAQQKLETRVQERTQELERNKERLQILLETTNAIPWQSDAETWEFTYVGPQAVELLGYPIEKWYEKDFWSDHLHPNDRRDAIAFCQQASRRLKDYEFTYRMIRADGKSVWLHDIVNVTHANEKPKMLRGFLIDVTKQKRAERLQKGYYEAIAELAEARDLKGFLDQFARTIERELEPGVICSILLVDAEKKILRHGAGPSLPDEYNAAIDGIDIGPTMGSCGTAAYLGKRVIVTDTLSDPLWRDFRTLAKRFQLRACWSEPILAEEGQVLGTFAMYAQSPHEPSNDELLLIEKAAHLAGVAIERWQAHEALRQSETALRKSERDLRYLTGKLLTAQEEERRHLARELHDDLTQRLAVLAIEAGKLEKKLGEALNPLHAYAQQMKDQIVKLSSDVHNISRQLHPSILDDLGLADALRSECSAYSEREGIKVHCEIENIPTEIPSDVAICLYRIAQEGLRNIAKYADVDSAEVSLIGANGALRLSVKDTGVGFDPKVMSESPSLGFVSMAERCRLIKGEFSVRSQPGGGTAIEVQAPLDRRGS